MVTHVALQQSLLYIKRSDHSPQDREGRTYAMMEFYNGANCVISMESCLQGTVRSPSARSQMTCLTDAIMAC
eukprot:11447873-Karenia_brevis.AAC.1